MKKLLILTVCAAVFLTLLAGCGKKASAVNLSDIREKMLDASDLPAMLSADSDDDDAERKLAALTSIDYDKVDGYFIEYAADGAAYEIAVIRLNSESDAEKVKKDLKKHIESRTEQYRYYMPEQVKNAENATVAVHSTDVALIMCDDPAAVKDAFEKTVG